MATLARGITFGSTETVTNAKLHALVDDGSISGIVNADIATDALIDSSKINFSLSDYVTLAGVQTITGAKTFDTTTTFNTPLANTNIAAITQASKVSGSSFYNLASCISGAGKLPAANVPTIDTLLPAQGSANGKYLTSNGSVASWGTVTVPTQYINLISTTDFSGTSITINIDSSKYYMAVFTAWVGAGNPFWNVGPLTSDGGSYNMSATIFISKAFNSKTVFTVSGYLFPCKNTISSTITSFQIDANGQGFAGGQLKLYEIIQ